MEIDAWRKLVKNLDPKGAGRCRALLKNISSERCQIGELGGMIEWWEANVRNEESGKDQRGAALKLSSGLKMTAFANPLS